MLVGGSEFEGTHLVAVGGSEFEVTLVAVGGSEFEVTLVAVGGSEFEVTQCLLMVQVLTQWLMVHVSTCS